MSLPAWGAWIEIWGSQELEKEVPCRSPHGERGLKYIRSTYFGIVPGRSPHGERGLKYVLDVAQRCRGSRSPHGERGLK